MIWSGACRLQRDGLPPWSKETLVIHPVAVRFQASVHMVLSIMQMVPRLFFSSVELASAPFWAVWQQVGPPISRTTTINRRGCLC